MKLSAVSGHKTFSFPFWNKKNGISNNGIISKKRQRPINITRQYWPQDSSSFSRLADRARPALAWGGGSSFLSGSSGSPSCLFLSGRGLGHLFWLVLLLLLPAWWEEGQVTYLEEALVVAHLLRGGGEGKGRSLMYGAGKGANCGSPTWGRGRAGGLWFKVPPPSKRNDRYLLKHDLHSFYVRGR